MKTQPLPAATSFGRALEHFLVANPLPLRRPPYSFTPSVLIYVLAHFEPFFS